MAIFNGSAKNDPDLHGTDGDDWIAGNQGNDTISGLKGNDIIDGGPGADTFIFHPGDGDDTIWNFSATGKHDTIKFQGVDENTVSYAQSGRDVIITYGDPLDPDHCLIQNTTVDKLHGDILFS